MWQILAEECWTLVCSKTGGGVLSAIPPNPDLRALCDLFSTLDDEEQQFRITLIRLYEEAWQTHVPSGAKIDVNQEQYQAFLSAIPKQPPRTRRGYWLFQTQAEKEPMATLLKSAAEESRLPAWI